MIEPEENKYVSVRHRLGHAPVSPKPKLVCAHPDLADLRLSLKLIGEQPVRASSTKIRVIDRESFDPHSNLMKVSLARSNIDLG